jgi:SAM-dependent methyltransferase
MTTQKIKEQVQDKYASIALNSTSCCSPSCCQSSLVDYQDLTKSIPQESDLGLGCGTPTKFAKIQPGNTVLDLGSGAGIDVFLAAGLVGETGLVTGIDMTPEMIKRAEENAQKGQYPNVTFKLGDIESLPIDSGTQDVVLSNCVINLATDKRKVFKEVYRVLKTGGHLTISDIITQGCLPEDIRRDMELWAGCIAGALEKEIYLGIIREIGFKDLEIHKLTEYNNQNKYGIASITLTAYK